MDGTTHATEFMGASSLVRAWNVTSSTVGSTNRVSSTTLRIVALSPVFQVAGTTTNSAPTVATAILDQTATTGAPFSFAFPDTTFTDADSDTLTYAATLADDTDLPSWLSFDPATHTFSGTPTAVETVSVKVTASDASDSVSDTFDIVVSAAVTGICSRALAVQTPILAATSRTACADVTTADLASVITLNVTAYGPTSIDPADFEGLTGLTTLQIDASPQLTTVPDNAFAGLTALTTLDFSVLFSLTTLGEDAFAGLTTLTRLDLNFNDGLAALDADIFDGLTALEHLHLAYTNLAAPGCGHLRWPHRPENPRSQ